MNNKTALQELKNELKAKLIVGAKVRIGKEYVKEIGNFKEGEIITLIEGYFNYENGLYTEIQTAPSILCEDEKDFDSIYHLFGNDFEHWFDCEVVFTPPISITNKQ